MITQDYLMRMLLAFFQALVNSRTRAIDEKDYDGAADMLENTIGDAANMDPTMLLSLSPDSLVGILQATGVDPKVTEFMARSLMEVSNYRQKSGEGELADLREKQARAIAEAYGHDMTITVQEFLDNCDFANQENE